MFSLTYSTSSSEDYDVQGYLRSLSTQDDTPWKRWRCRPRHGNQPLLRHIPQPQCTSMRKVGKNSRWKQGHVNHKLNQDIENFLPQESLHPPPSCPSSIHVAWCLTRTDYVSPSKVSSYLEWTKKTFKRVWPHFTMIKKFPIDIQLWFFSSFKARETDKRLALLSTS